MTAFSRGAALRRYRSRLLVAVSLVASTAVPATAQVHNWTGGTGSWFTAGNWSPASAPPAGEIVNIANGGTAQIGAAAGTMQSVTVKGGSTVDLQAGGSLATNFGFAITAGDGSGTASNGTILLSGSSALTNTIQLVTGTLASNISAVMANQISLIGNNNLISTASGTTLELNFSSITAGGTVIGGGGKVIYTGDTFYTGPTTINAGSTLQLGSGGLFGSIQGGGGIVNNGTLAISHSGTFNQGANVSGTGGITILPGNTATVGFTGTNSYSGITDIQGGTLSLNNLGGISATSTFNVGSGTTLELSGISATLNNLTGSGTVNIRQTDPGAGSTLTLNSANFTGTITQNPVGGIVQAQNLVVGTGTVILAGTNSWVGTTTVNSGGTLQLGNGGTGGSIPTGTITNNGTLAINRSDNVTYSGNIGGSGILVKSGTGTLSLTSANSYSGGTAVAGGTLRLGVSGAAGSGSITTTGSVIDYADGITVANPIVINSNTTQLQALAGVTATQSGVISQTGGARPLEKIGAGTLILTGLNSYTGGTTVTAGTLSIGTGGSLDSNGAVTVTGGTFNINGNSITVAALTGTGGTVNIDAFGTLSTYSNSNGTLASLVTGAGRLLKGGTGVYTISNANTFSGGLTIVDGTVLLTNNAAAGTGTITITAPATLDLANGLAVANNIGLVTSAAKLNQTGGTVTLSGVISETAGVRAVEKTGTGTIILAGNNTYTGVTTITAGTLQVGNGGGTGAVTGNIVNNAALVFNRGINLGYAGAISGAGSVTLTGPATIFYTGDNTYTGGTTITAGSLQIGAAGTSGSVAGNISVASGATLNFNRTDTATFGGVISGAGTLQQLGTGTVILTGANTHTGGTTISAGTLQIGNGGTSGSIAGNVSTVGTLAFNRSDAVIYAGVVGGAGGLAKAGAGTLTLTGANTYTGVTTITAGTLQIGSGGTTGSIAGNVANSGTLAFNRSDSLTFAGVISGTGAVTKAGAGILTLTGASTYSGATTVSGGTLAVNGSIGSSAVTVAQGAILGGTGTAGATMVQSGGTLAPGNSIGTLSVNGNLTLASASTYTVELSPTAADRTTVSGTASLNGTLALLPGAGTYTAGTTLTLLSANSVSGTFASVTGLSFPGVKSEIVYSATSVQLVLSQLAVNFAGRTPNQIAAAAALNAGPIGNPLQTALSNYLTANPAQMEAVLDSVSGEIHASVRGAALEDSRMIRNTVQVRLDGGAEAAGLWGYGFADYGWLDSDGNAAEATRNNAGFIGGFDTLVMDGLRLGVGGAYMEHKVGVAARGSRAAGSRTSLLAYASYESGPLNVRLGGDYGWGTDNVTRVVAALGETERSRRTNEGGSFFARASYDFGLPVVPYAGITHAAASNGAFTETGGLAALIGGTASENQTYSLLGLNLELGALDLHGMALTPRADIAWSHALDAMAAAQSVSLSTGRSFTVLGAPIGTDAAAIQLGLDLAIAPDALFSVGYDGFFSNRGQSNAVRGGFRWKF
jgi:autotransporter-associated beta strand protein